MSALEGVEEGDARCAGYALSAVTWLLFAVAFIAELDRYVPNRTWLIRFPILFIFAGEIAKLRCAPAPVFTTGSQARPNLVCRRRWSTPIATSDQSAGTLSCTSCRLPTCCRASVLEASCWPW